MYVSRGKKYRTIRYRVDAASTTTRRDNNYHLVIVCQFACEQNARCCVHNNVVDTHGRTRRFRLVPYRACSASLRLEQCPFTCLPQVSRFCKYTYSNLDITTAARPTTVS